MAEIESGEINYLKEANLLPPKHAVSKVWNFFRFRHKTEPSPITGK